MKEKEEDVAGKRKRKEEASRMQRCFFLLLLLLPPPPLLEGLPDQVCVWVVWFGGCARPSFHFMQGEVGGWMDGGHIYYLKARILLLLLSCAWVALLGTVAWVALLGTVAVAFFFSLSRIPASLSRLN